MRQRFREIKTGLYFISLAHGVDRTNVRDGLPIIIYHPDDNEHLILVKEED
jgi:hypothetical protein